MSFAEYSGLVAALSAEGRTTGTDNSPAMVEYTRLNDARMRRLQKTVQAMPWAADAAQNVQRRMIWLILTESWCGDAAQNIPPIEKIAEHGQNIETRYLLRDENLPLMDRFLTEGGRAIPKLIAVDAESYEIIGSWGSRPVAAQALYHQMKEEGRPKSEIGEALQRWYLADKTISLQTELEHLMREWDVARSIAAV